ncbi:DsbA family protein [Candidatus Leptofilum sp.]|uniref:DsbA family protein n=1 Tax=Candidatus Leptofilum sp. TaxID=3241576 RepID=UPI003B5A97F3
MFFSTKKNWWLLALILLLAACGAADANPITTDGTAANELLPRDGSSLLQSADADGETAVANNNPAINVVADSVEYDADGIEVGFTEEGRPYRGNPNAPVIIEEFSDFQCPFCGRFSEQTFPSINSNQIANGDVLLVFYDFPLNIHPQAEAAANAARCAGEQSAVAYWEMHDLLFANISEWSHNQANVVFTGYGETLDLQMDSFTNCLESDKYISNVRADYDVGLSRGVSSTPSFFINDQPFIGAQPLATFNEAIALVLSGESIVEAPTENELQPEFAIPTPVPIPVEPETVAWSAGNPDAPVQIVEFTDYQCPFCQQYAMETFPTVFTEMIESGRVFYAIKDLPLDNIHAEAIVAATAVRCAGEQEAYKEMHDAVFANQALWGGSGETAATNVFVDLAKDIGLDSDALVSCIELGEQRERVLANQQESFALGVSSTPTFYMNGYPLRGAQPYDVFDGVAELIENGELEATLEAQMQQAYAQAQAQATQEAQPQPPAQPVEISIEGAHAVGDPNAPVTIIEYTDFQCPFCSRHYEQTFLQLKEDYIDAGLVYYVFKDFPLTQIHPDAVLAANAARCAGDQGAYLDMHGALFSNQDEWNGRPNPEAFFNQYAAEMGLDEEQFATCVANATYDAEIYADLDEGFNLGVSGTPAFFLNGYFLSGAQPYGTFVDAIVFLMEEVGE